MYIATFDDYICAFKQSTLFRQYLQGGPSSHGPNRNELLFRRIWRLNGLVRFATIVANYTSISSFINCLSHLKGEEVFGSFNWPNDCPLNIDNDSHRSNHVNFFHSSVTIPLVEPNIMDNVHMQQPPSSSSKLLPLVS